jgi:hypothetical protein
MTRPPEQEQVLQSWICRAVRDNGGAALVSVKELRDKLGFKRAKVLVVRQIADEIHAAGLQHLPGHIPKAENMKVLVYDPSAPIGEKIAFAAECVRGSFHIRYEFICEACGDVHDESAIEACDGCCRGCGSTDLRRG